MTINLGQLIVWIIIGGLAGALAGSVFTRRKRGFGMIGNIVLGLLGALIGGALFNLLNINLGLPALTFRVDDLVAAFVGAGLLIFLIGFIRRR